MFKQICLLLFLSLTFSSRVLGPAGSALTIYNGGQSIVKDVRQVLYDRPKSTIYFSKVASTILPDTIIVNPNNRGVRIYDTSYNSGVQSEGKYATLQNYINKTISFKSGDNITHRGKLLAFGTEKIDQGGSGQYSNKFINKDYGGSAVYADFIKILNPLTGQIQIYDSFNSLKLPQLKTNTIKSPTILITAGAGSPISSPTEASYRATGFSWTASYAVYLYPDETRANLSGYVNVENKSGKNFTNTNLSLITGQVNVVQDNYNYNGYAGGQASGLTMQTSRSQQRPNFTPQPISDYHMYTLNRRVNVNDGSNRQIQLFNTVTGASVIKKYTAGVDSGANYQDVKFTNEYTIRDTKANGLGGPLPAGIVRVFKRDSRGSTQFVGEDRTGHVAQGQNITIRTGSPFDLKAQYIVRNRTDLKKKNKLTNTYEDYGSLYAAKLQLKITNSALRPASIELTLKNRQNLQLSYDPGYKGPRWQEFDANSYKIRTTIPGNSTGSIYWNERVAQ